MLLSFFLLHFVCQLGGGSRRWKHRVLFGVFHRQRDPLLLELQPIAETLSEECP